MSSQDIWYNGRNYGNPHDAYVALKLITTLAEQLEAQGVLVLSKVRTFFPQTMGLNSIVYHGINIGTPEEIAQAVDAGFRLLEGKRERGL